ncbi:MAG: hypothetical protein ACE5G5_06345 [Candidatus Methylomirabilales bacterium]
MDAQRQQILDYLVGYWWEQFNLVPAMDIAENLQIAAAEVLTILEEMAKEGSVELYQQQRGPKDPGVVERSISAVFRSTYVLPSRSVLKARFEALKQDFGIYKNLLHMGVSQEELFRFRPAILDHYKQNPDVEVTGDLIATTRTALKREGVHPVYVRYRWATGISGDRYIIVNLWDLAELNQEEQALWAHHEITELRDPRA